MSLKTLKQLMDGGRFPDPSFEVVYVGKIKFDGDTPTVEEIDMSKVTYKAFKLTEESRKEAEKRREERRKKYNL